MNCEKLRNDPEAYAACEKSNSREPLAGFGLGVVICGFVLAGVWIKNSQLPNWAQAILIIFSALVVVACVPVFMDWADQPIQEVIHKREQK